MSYPEATLQCPSCSCQCSYDEYRKFGCCGNCAHELRILPRASRDIVLYPPVTATPSKCAGCGKPAYVLHADKVFCGEDCAREYLRPCPSVVGSVLCRQLDSYYGVRVHCRLHAP